MAVMNFAPEARILGDGTKTDLAIGAENCSLDLDMHRASIPTSTKQSEVDVKAAAENVGMVENVSPENWSLGQATNEVLEPTWTEGYMNKEAFKIIAKMTMAVQSFETKGNPGPSYKLA
ncbi:hypothetical protein KP509_24G021600 [Ceratopteris richardii]|uniref:Uncharacterized protein n=1 Tax=Ceratopteris richardii TaxID=49495 RepID=A0A8T2RV64_CERRI|nr:hypothetical protein KP509_24G021600 [Ceratopteris richardii]